MIIIHTVYCVLGRTSSGKSTITQKAANNLNMKVLKSYTTRQRRENETDENCDHIFISPNEVEKYRNDMIAYTEPPGYIDLYFNQPRFFEKLKFMQWAQWAVKKLSQYYTIKIVSHGYSPNLKQKESYIKEWFPFAEFIGVNLKEYSDKAHIDMSDGWIIGSVE